MRPSGKRWPWLMLMSCAAVAFFAFAFPMYVIRPFVGQEPRALSLALEVRRWGPPAAIVAALIAVASLLRIWSGARWPARTLSALALAWTAAFAVLSHVNVYERMFHPIPEPEFLSAAEAKLEPDDMVLAVKLGGASHAYPIRMMGYHHIVNDWLAGVPLVGTY